MKHQRAVTEADFRLPEFRAAKLEDYELRPGDDKPVRKDRWQTGILQIASAVGLHNRQGFEISQVVEAVERLTKDAHSWETEDLPEKDSLIDVKLNDGSVLIGVSLNNAGKFASWGNGVVLDMDRATAWRVSAPVAIPHE